MKLNVKAEYKTGTNKKDSTKTWEAVAFEATDENGKTYKAFAFPERSMSLDHVKAMVFETVKK